MRISINVAHHGGSGGYGGAVAHLEEVVTAADELGLDTVWVGERLLGGGGEGPADDEAVPDAYTALGFLASRSTRVRLGAMAGPLTHRLPALTVRAAATLDALSGGRARLGVSSGHPEHGGHGGTAFQGGHGRDALHGGGRRSAGPGLAPPPLAERFAYVEDLLRLAHCTAHPPVTVAGLGEARMLPLVARYADAWNVLDVPGDCATLRRKLDILAVHCRKAGRPLAGIDLAATARPEEGETSTGLVARCRGLAALGFDHVVLAPDRPWTPRALDTLAVAAPAIAELSRQPDTLATVVRIDAYRKPASGIPA